MNVRLTINFTDEFRRALNKHEGLDGLATEQELESWVRACVEIGREAIPTVDEDDEQGVPEDVTLGLLAPWILAETGGGCTAITRDRSQHQLVITAALDPRAPAQGEASILGIYRFTDGDAIQEWNKATRELAIAMGDRFGFVADGVAFFAFPEVGSFLGVARLGSPMPHLMAAPMYADGTADTQNIHEVLSIADLDLNEVNEFFGTSFKEVRWT